MKITKSRFEEIIREELEKHLDEIGRKLPSQIPTNRPEPEHGYDKAGFPRTKPKDRDEELREALDAMHDLSTYMEKHTTHWQDEITVDAVEEWIGSLQKSIKIVSKVLYPGQSRDLMKESGDRVEHLDEGVKELAAKLAKNPKMKNALVAALMGMGVSLGGGDALASGGDYQPNNNKWSADKASSFNDNSYTSNNKSFFDGNKKTSFTTGGNKGYSIKDGTDGSVYVTAAEQHVGKRDVVSNMAKELSQLGVDTSNLQKDLLKTGGTLSKDGKTRTYKLQKSR